MFIYCLNNPVIYCDPAGTQAQIWPTLFGNHDPGYIHRAVQAHIIATGLFQKELYLPGTGRVDIYDPETFEIWEIKHGGSTTETQISRTESAKEQVRRYKSSNKIYRKGHAGAFTGAFVINSNNVSYLVTYHTPDDGVILYYVQEMPHYEPLASFSYDISVVSVEKNTHTAVVGGALVGGVFLGGGSFDPLLQTCNTN